MSNPVDLKSKSQVNEDKNDNSADQNIEQNTKAKMNEPKQKQSNQTNIEVEMTNTKSKQQISQNNNKSDEEKLGKDLENNNKDKNEPGNLKETNDLEHKTENISVENILKKSYNRILENIDPILNITYVISFVVVVFIQFNVSLEYDSIKRVKQALGVDVIPNTIAMEDFNYVYTFNKELVYNISLSNFVLAEKLPVVSTLRTSLKRFKNIIGHNDLIIGLNKTIAKRNNNKITSFDYFDYNNEDDSNLNNAFVYDNKTSFFGRGGYLMELTKDELTNFRNTGNTDKSLADFLINSNAFNKTLIDYINNYNNKFLSIYLTPKTNPACVTFDFVLVNVETSYIIPVSIMFVFTSSGQIEFTHSITEMNSHLYTTRLDIFRLVFEIILAFSILVYFIFFVKNLTYETSKVYLTEKQKLEKIVKEEINLKRKKEMELSKMNKDKIKEELKKKMKRNIGMNMMFKKKEKSKSKFKYLMNKFSSSGKGGKEGEKDKDKNKDKLTSKKNKEKEKEMKKFIEREVNNRVESRPVIMFKLALFNYTFLVISVVLSLLCVIFWVIYIVKHSLFWKNIPNVYMLLESPLSLAQMNTLLDINSTLRSYKIIVCLNFLVLFLRLLGILQSIIKRTIIFSNTLASGIMDLIYFFILYLNYCLGASIFCFYFYRNVVLFHNFQTTLQTIVDFSVHPISNISDNMFKENRILTIAILYFIIIFLKYIWLKIVLATIIYWYHFSIHIYEIKNNAVNYRTKTLDELFKLPRQIVYRIILFIMGLVNSFIDCIFCIKSDEGIKKMQIVPNEGWRSLISNRRILQGLRSNNYLDTIPSKNIYLRIEKQLDTSERNALIVEENNHNEIDSKGKQQQNGNAETKKKPNNINDDNNNAVLTDEGGETKLIKVNKKDNAGRVKSKEINKDAENNQERDLKLSKNNNNLEYDSSKPMNNTQDQKDKIRSKENNNENNENDINMKLMIIKNQKPPERSSLKTSMLVPNNIDEYTIATPSDAVKCNIVMSDQALIGKRDIYFDSEKDIFMNTVFNEKKYKFTIIDLSLYVVFFVCLIISSFMAMYSPLKYIMNDSITGYFDKHPLDSTLRLNSVNSLERLRTFVFRTIPSFSSIDNNNFIILNFNKVLRGGIICTVKRNIAAEVPYKNGTTDKYSIDPSFGFREINETISLKNNRHENSSDFKISSDLEFDYSMSKSYNRFGGFVHVVSLFDIKNEYRTWNEVKGNYPNKTDYYYDGPLGRNLTSKEQKALINEYTDFVFLEMYLRNNDFNITTAINVEFEVTKGGRINSKIVPYFFKSETTDTYTIVGYVFDSLFCCFFLVNLVFFIIRTTKRYLSYTQWEKENIRVLSIKTQELRFHINPEIMRRLFFIINGDFALSLFIVILGGFYIVFRILNIINSIQLSTYLDSTSKQAEFRTLFELQSLFYKNTTIQQALLYISTLFLLTLSLRLLFTIDFGKYFGVTVGTIQEASSLLLIFCLILLLTQPPFVCYSYIAFGTNLWHFNTWISSLLYTLIQMFGRYNYPDATDTEGDLGPLHFYLYVFIINIVLLTLFIAVLDKAYIIIKERIIRINEEFDYKYIFFFCCYRRKPLYDDKNIKIEMDFESDKITRPVDFSLIPFKDTSIGMKEFINLEVSKQNSLSDELDVKANKMSIYESAYISNQAGIESDILIAFSYFKHIKAEHYFSYCWILSDYLNNVNQQNQNQIIEIETEFEHITQFRRFRNSLARTKILIKKNEESLTEVAKFEGLIKCELKEIDKYRKIENKLENMDAVIQNEFYNEYSFSNDHNDEADLRSEYEKDKLRAEHSSEISNDELGSPEGKIKSDEGNTNKSHSGVLDEKDIKIKNKI